MEIDRKETGRKVKGSRQAAGHRETGDHSREQGVGRRVIGHLVLKEINRRVRASRQAASRRAIGGPSRVSGHRAIDHHVPIAASHTETVRNKTEEASLTRIDLSNPEINLSKVLIIRIIGNLNKILDPRKVGLEGLKATGLNGTGTTGIEATVRKVTGPRGLKAVSRKERLMPGRY